MGKKDPRLISGMPGMGLTDAAKLLDVTTDRLKQWLESGILKGLKIHGPRGRWKINQKDIVEFGRKHPELVGKKRQ